MSGTNLIALYSPGSGHGKDVVARAFLNNLLDVPEEVKLKWSEVVDPTINPVRAEILDYSRWKIKKFAYGSKHMAATLYNVPVSKFEDREWRAQIQPPYPITPLDFQIALSNSVKEFMGQDVWVEQLFSEFDENSKWIISDMRFPLEYEKVKSLGGKVFKVEMPECAHPKQIKDGLLDDYEFDEVIINDKKKWLQMVGFTRHLIQKYKLADSGTHPDLHFSVTPTAT